MSLLGRLLSPLRPLVGWLYGIVILITSVFGNYIITMFLPLLYTGQHWLWRSYMDRAISFWMVIPMTFLEWVFGVTFRVSGDAIDADEAALIIMNHRTRLDWMYLWSSLYQMNPWLITTNKITMKAQLKSLPGAGFGMAANQFVFLERNMEKDKETLENAIDYYKGLGKNYQILLFPEGTDKSPWTTRKSDEYAKKNGLRPLKHCIYPRQAGFYHLISKMREENYCSYVYNVTIAYPWNIVQSEMDLVLKGQAPREVHMHVEKIPVSAVPKTEADIGRWMVDLWHTKDAQLDAYYAEEKPWNRRFPVAAGQGSWNSAKESWRKMLVKVLSCSYWLFIISVWLYHITFLTFLQIGFAYFLLSSGVIGYLYGGIDKFVFLRWKQSQPA